MKYSVIFLFLSVLVCACENRQTFTVSSPNGQLEASVYLSKDNSIYYSISRNGVKVVQDSKLGIEMEDTAFLNNLNLISATKTKLISDRYSMMIGKRKDIVCRANEKTFSFINDEQKAMDIIFRVSDDGIAFRYVFPGQSEDMKQIVKEITTFNLKSDSRAWLQPMQVAQTGWKNVNPAYEEHYQMDIKVGTPAPTEAGWVFPALFESNGSWILITESGMDGRYCASRLEQNALDGEYSLGFPMAPEVFTGGGLLPESNLPFHSPWRIIAVGSLATIVESTLGTDLAAATTETELSYIKPGQASWSWALLKDDSITYDIQKEFIDYASDMQWEYALVDVNWDTTIGYDKIKKLAEYASTKNVGLLLWYNSSGDWNETDYHPKSMLLTHAARVKEFSRLQNMGIKGIKVDFFAGDGKSMIQYYIDILKDAADYRLLVNFHGATIPRGLQRTYPNLMTVEAVKGFEYITFTQESADLEASHSTMLPFTRNAFDPMDFTPMVFYKIPNRVRKTTNGFQLALPIIFLSGIQHMAETPEGMQTVSETIREFVRGLPEQWDDTRFIDGYPGKLAVVARRSGDSWYIAGINGEATSKTLSLDLSFIDGNSGYMITDGAEDLSFKKENIVASNSLAVELKPNGGFVLLFK